MKTEAQVLGMPLEQALLLAGDRAGQIQIVRTDAPRNERTAGTLRVIRVRGDEWTVAAFLDGMPKASHA